MGESGRCVLIGGDQVRIWNREKDHSSTSFEGVAKLERFEGRTRAGSKAGDPTQEQWLVKFADGHKETRWVSFLDLYIFPKTYADATKEATASPTLASLLPKSGPVNKGVDKALLKLAATVIVDCIRCPESMNVQKSLDELTMVDDEPEVYALLLEFSEFLEKTYNVESVWEEIVDDNQFSDVQDDNLEGNIDPRTMGELKSMLEEQAKKENQKDEAVGGTA